MAETMKFPFEATFDEIKANYKSIGTAHNAVDDCKFQIGYCSEIWRSLNCH